MASDPRSDRFRLVIEPNAIERAGALAAQENDLGSAPQRRPKEMIDLDRLEDEDEFVDDEPPRRRRALPIALAVIALAGFGAVTWWAYTSQLGPAPEEAIPLIRADAGPIKTRPANPGGMDVPYQDKLVLNEIAPDPNLPQVERLLPPPEVPRPPIPQTAEPAAGAGGTGQDVAGPVPRQATSGLAPAAGAPTAADTGTASQPAVPAPPSQAAEAAAPAGLTPAARIPAVPPAPQAAATAAAPAKPLQTAAGGSFLVQFASLKDRSLVDGEWSRLQRAFGDLLGDKEMVVQSVDLGTRGTFHRLRAGFFPDRDSAAAMCRKLEALKQACIVVKP